MNDTGLSALVRLPRHKSVLLSGDACYSSIPASMRGSVHGGRFPPGDVPPTPAPGDRRLVISCGRDNVYGHPHAEAIAAHSNAGWGVPEMTRKQASQARGDRFFYGGP
jgi:hypothetical protein